MNRPKARDWTGRHDDPPSLAGATTLVVPNRRLLFRAALPTGLIAAGFLGAAWGTDNPVPGVTISVLLLAVSVVRTVWWARGMGSRTLLETPTHLVLCRSGVAEQWVAWEDLERVIVVSSNFAPEWNHTRTDWFHLEPYPQLAVMPPTAFVTGFGDMLVSSRGSRAAADRVRAVVHARGIPCETD